MVSSISTIGIDETDERRRQKQWVAVSSMLAAVLLTAAKLTVASLTGSLVIVVVGTFLKWPSEWLAAADALAGVLVAFIILPVAFGLAVRAVNALTDRVPPTLVDEAASAAANAPGTLGRPSARLRFVGDQPGRLIGWRKN